MARNFTSICHLCWQIGWMLRKLDAQEGFKRRLSQHLCHSARHPLAPSALFVIPLCFFFYSAPASLKMGP